MTKALLDLISTGIFLALVYYIFSLLVNGVILTVLGIMIALVFIVKALELFRDKL